MSETKHIDPAALATITCGTVLVDFGKVHEAMEWVMGHPIWTHEMPMLAERITAAVLAQFPEMPTAEPANWEALRDDLHRAYGDTVEVRRGSQERTQSPLATLEAAIGPDKPIIVLGGAS